MSLNGLVTYKIYTSVADRKSVYLDIKIVFPWVNGSYMSQLPLLTPVMKGLTRCQEELANVGPLPQRFCLLS